MTQLSTLNKIQKEIAQFMEGEDRPDGEFRLALVLSQMGSLAKYLTHDPSLNPRARIHGTREEEIHAFGQVLVQIIGYAVTRGININQALELGMENWRVRDWQKVQAEQDTTAITGITACFGIAEGPAFVDPRGERLHEFTGGILVMRFLRPKHTIYLMERRVTAIVTDQGSKVSHPAIIAREFNIPCIVATGNATERISHGQIVRIEANENQGFVYLLE